MSCPREPDEELSPKKAWTIELQGGAGGALGYDPFFHARPMNRPVPPESTWRALVTFRLRASGEPRPAKYRSISFLRLGMSEVLKRELRREHAIRLNTGPEQ